MWTDSWIRRKKNTAQPLRGSNSGWMEWSRQERISKWTSFLLFSAFPSILESASTRAGLFWVFRASSVSLKLDNDLSPLGNVQIQGGGGVPTRSSWAWSGLFRTSAFRLSSWFIIAADNFEQPKFNVLRRVDVNHHTRRTFNFGCAAKILFQLLFLMVTKLHLAIATQVPLNAWLARHLKGHTCRIKKSCPVQGANKPCEVELTSDREIWKPCLRLSTVFFVSFVSTVYTR